MKQKKGRWLSKEGLKEERSGKEHHFNQKWTLLLTLNLLLRKDIIPSPTNWQVAPTQVWKLLNNWAYHPLLMPPWMLSHLDILAYPVIPTLDSMLSSSDFTLWFCCCTLTFSFVVSCCIWGEFDRLCCCNSSCHCWRNDDNSSCKSSVFWKI